MAKDSPIDEILDNAAEITGRLEGALQGCIDMLKALELPYIHSLDSDGVHCLYLEPPSKFDQKTENIKMTFDDARITIKMPRSLDVTLYTMLKGARLVKSGKYGYTRYDLGGGHEISPGSRMYEFPAHDYEAGMKRFLPAFIAHVYPEKVRDREKPKKVRRVSPPAR